MEKHMQIYILFIKYRTIRVLRKINVKLIIQIFRDIRFDPQEGLAPFT